MMKVERSTASRHRACALEPSALTSQRMTWTSEAGVSVFGILGQRNIRQPYMARNFFPTYALFWINLLSFKLAQR